MENTENPILNLTNLYKEQYRLREIIKPYEKEINANFARIENIKKGLSYFEKKFISQKIYDAFTDDEKEAVQQYRKDVEKSTECYSIYAIEKRQFDPFFDEWNIISIEEKDSKIKIGVSCKKNEGSISGLLTFLDVHYTDWIDKKEILNI